MKDFSEELGFVNSKFILETLGISSSVLMKLAQVGVLVKMRRGYYSYESYIWLKKFMADFKGYFGHPASLQACILAHTKEKHSVKRKVEK